MKSKIKKMKELVLSVMTVLLCLLMAVQPVAIADGGTGSITINNVLPNQTYNVYRIFDLESYNADAEAYSYKASDKWKNFVEDTGALQYISVDGQGYISWKKDINNSTDTENFAKLVAQYAKTNSITPDLTQTTGNKPESGNFSPLSFVGIPLGYYLIDSTAGTLCALNTTNPDAIMTEKNKEPTVIKEVKQEGSDAYVKENHAKIGDTVSFRTTINAQKGADSYVLHDTMEPGLTFKNTVEITYVSPTENKLETLTTGYTLNTNPTDGCTFEVSFDKSFLDTLTKETPIYVKYDAVLNENAEYGTDENDSQLSNHNESYLKYGDSSRTVTSSTETYTYMFELVKTNATGVILQGATFKLLDADKNEIPVVKDTDTENTYRLATPTEKAAPGFKGDVITAGNVCVAGLIAGRYYLEEIDPPAGYNKLAAPVEFSMQDSDNMAHFSNDYKYQSGGVGIINNTGAVLPQTGGIGTTVFYAVGIAMIVIAGILMIAKKRTR